MCRQLRERAGCFREAVDLDEITTQRGHRPGERGRADRGAGVEHPAQAELSRSDIGNRAYRREHRRHEERDRDVGGLDGVQDTGRFKVTYYDAPRTARETGQRPRQAAHVKQR